MVNWVYIGQVTGGGQGGRREVASEDGQVSVARWARPGSGKRNLGAEGGGGDQHKTATQLLFVLQIRGSLLQFYPTLLPHLGFYPTLLPLLSREFPTFTQ